MAVEAHAPWKSRNVFYLLSRRQYRVEPFFSRFSLMDDSHNTDESNPNFTWIATV